MKTFRFQTIQDYKAWKMARRGALRSLLLLAFLVAFGLSHNAWQLIQAHTLKQAAKAAESHEQPGWTEGGVVFVSSSRVPIDHAEPPPLEVTKGLEFELLTSALRAWSDEGLDLKRPKLVRDGCNGDDSNSIACANQAKNTINITAVFPQFPADIKRTVLMHEIGHLLGVPHIDGDLLMNPVARGAVDKPTAAAVALAKLERSGGGR